MASPFSAELAHELIQSLKRAGLEAQGLKFNPHWASERLSRLDATLADSSHLLLVADAASAREAWFCYLVGLCRGLARPLALYRTDAAWEPLPWLSGLPVLDSHDEASAFYQVERVDWMVKEKRRQARATILELGISWHAESMAQCVREGDVKAVELFLDSGFVPDMRDKNGVPLMCLAARSRHHGIIETLLERGADVDIQSDDRGYTPLMDAAQQGDLALLDFLVAKGADTNRQSKDGQTALVLAVGRNDVPMTASLLSHGADPDLADKLGLSARKYARLFHNPDMEALLAV